MNEQLFRAKAVGYIRKGDTIYSPGEWVPDLDKEQLEHLQRCKVVAEAEEIVPAPEPKPKPKAKSKKK